MKKCIRTNRLPPPVGPYSQIVITNGFMFISGQIAIDPVTGNLISDNTEEQTRSILNAIRSVLEEQKLNLDSVIKVTVYLTSPNDFNAFNRVYAEYFTNTPPVRTTVFVNALPKDAKVELDVIAAMV
ncbi:MAG: RidA family protein [bacterium]